jgi:tRNA threonylcarbamoyladenosine biosynthesis protein TsaE
MMSAWSVISRSEKQTKNWGKKLAQLLQGGEIIGLTGELGAGKTCFVRGVAEGLQVGIRAWIRSPTFTLINEYQGRLPVYHIDLYRVSEHAQQHDLNLREYLYGDGVSLVEWFEYLPVSEGEEFLEISFAHTESSQRRLTFAAHGERYERMLRSLRIRGFKGSKNVKRPPSPFEP